MPELVAALMAITMSLAWTSSARPPVEPTRMMASTPMVNTFLHPPASLGIDPLSDQNSAGGIAWAFSEVPSVLVLIALLFQWYGSEKRHARRKDRQADRDGDKELAEYNAYLASLNARQG